MASEKETRQRKGTVEMFIDVHNLTNNLKGEIGEFISRSEMRRQTIHKNDHCTSSYAEKGRINGYCLL